MDQDTSPLIHVWIAEDDEELREILGISLASEQREIRLFQDGHAVLGAISTTSPDILVTDLMMPGVNGIQLLQEVKRLHPDCMVIIMTGYASLDSAIQAIHWGAYDYIRKPFKLDELEVVIMNACERITLMRENRVLLRRLRESMEELETMRSRWNEHIPNLLNLCWMISNEEKDSAMEFLLKQMDPIPPDPEIKKRPLEKLLDPLELLIQFKKDGLINYEEFSSFKKILLKRLEER